MPVRQLALALAVSATAQLLGCSDDSSKIKPGQQTSVPKTRELAGEPAAKPGRLDVAIVRSRLEKKVKSTRAGDKRTYSLTQGITIESEELRTLYSSGGSTFVGFRARAKVGDAPCIIDWSASLVAGPGGQGEEIDRIRGTMAAEAGSIVDLSAPAALVPAMLPRIESVNVGYWTVCGEAIGTPSPRQVHIDEVSGEELRLAKLDRAVHHTSLWVEASYDAPRCHFELVAEDVDADGFVLNRDVAAYSLAGGKKTNIKIKRTDVDGGRDQDYEKAIAGKRVHIGELECPGPLTLDPSRLSGIAIDGLGITVHQGEPETVDELTKASFRHRARLVNKTGKDCSFSIRYQLLDKHGVALSMVTPLGETVHLAKGARVSYESQGNKLLAWRDQVDDIAQLVVTSAKPIEDCKRFDPTRALGASKR